MAVYVDFANISFRGDRWCHLLADSLEEMHEFTALIGVSRCWFHRNASYPHYDITIRTREIAISYGAIPSDRKTIIECAKKLKLELNYEYSVAKNLKQLELF